jgi:hypothetical protein
MRGPHATAVLTSCDVDRGRLAIFAGTAAWAQSYNLQKDKRRVDQLCSGGSVGDVRKAYNTTDN